MRSVVYVIHRRVKRTQLYLDEETARLLAAESRRRGTTVSWLVRDAIASQYGTRRGTDRGTIIDRLAGVWADRDDLASSWIRIQRRSSRPTRWRGGADAEVPARQRRHRRVASPKRRGRPVGDDP